MQILNWAETPKIEITSKECGRNVRLNAETWLLSKREKKIKKEGNKLSTPNSDMKISLAHKCLQTLK